MTFQLVKEKGKWAIFDTISRVFYWGKKKELEKRLEELNKAKIERKVDFDYE